MTKQREGRDDMREESDAEFEAFLAGVDRTLTRLYGPDHQAILAGGPGLPCRSFEWGDSPKRLDLPS